MQENILDGHKCLYKRDHKAVLFFAEDQVDRTSRYVITILLASILGVFVYPSLQVITGPVLTACFVYLYFRGDQAFVTSIIIVANDSLGCIFMGNIAFPYLLFGLVSYSILKTHLKIKIRKSQLIAGFIMMLTLVQLYSFHMINAKSILYTVTFIVAAGYNMKKDEDVEMFFKGVAITVLLISLHTCITGGVEFYELNEYSTAFLRKGVLGVGIGDSNYSTLLLNFGAACALFDRNFKWYTKLGITVLALAAMMVTLSTSGLIGFLLLLIGFVLVKRDSIPSKAWKIILLLLGLALLFNIYINLPETMQNETINAYIERMLEKIGFLQSGDMSAFTTNRSSIADQKLDYFVNGQGVMKQLFGFNSLFADGSNAIPHNTYIDLLLQIGLVGTAMALGYIALAAIRAWKDVKRNRRDLLLKLIMMYYFLNLSIYQGSIFALAYLVLIIL